MTTPATAAPDPDPWAVFVFRDQVFFERRSVLERLPYLRAWFDWEVRLRNDPAVVKWVDAPRELGQWLQRATCQLPALDSEALPSTLTAARLGAMLEWARTSDLSALTPHFPTFHDLHVAIDYWSPGSAVAEGIIRRPRRLPYLQEELDIPVDEIPDAARPGRWATTLAHTMLRMSPGALSGWLKTLLLWMFFSTALICAGTVVVLFLFGEHPPPVPSLGKRPRDVELLEDLLDMVQQQRDQGECLSTRPDLLSGLTRPFEVWFEFVRSICTGSYDGLKI